MSKTLYHQFRTAAKFRWRESADKHALKAEGVLPDGAWIFGHSTSINLSDFANNFCNWLKLHNRHYKMLKDIPVAAWNDFLEDKSQFVGPVTLENYESRIRTWEKIINAAYGTNIRWSAGLLAFRRLKPEEKEIQRIQQMQREDFTLIMGYIRESESKSHAVVALN